jgi:hypothetical protein
VSRWQTGSGPGAVVNPRRAIRLLKHTSSQNSHDQGWTGIPVLATVASEHFLLACLHDLDECARSCAGVEVRFTAQNRDVSLCKLRRVNHRVLSQAPGDGMSSRGRSSRPTGSIQREPTRLKRGAMATKNMPTSHHSMAMDQFHQRGVMALQSVLRPEPRAPTAGRHWAMQRIISLTDPADRAFRRGHMKKTAKETVLEMQSGRRRNRTLWWLSSDARNWLSFIARYQKRTLDDKVAKEIVKSLSIKEEK